MRTRTLWAQRLGLLSTVVALAACSSGTPNPMGQGGHGGATHIGPGTMVTPPTSSDETAERARVSAALTAVADLDASGLAAKYPAVFAPRLTYDPLTATNLSLIRDSKLGLNSAEEQLLARNGFVISARRSFPTFAYGYASIYADHLPLFVSADSILYAVHRSYDEMLKQIELASLRGALSSLLTGMRAALASGTLAALGAESAKDADLYLAVALGLLDGGKPAPVAGAAASEIASLIDKATAAAGAQEVTLFGTKRDEDFSQFKPRGHYTESPQLTSYFKAMMWLGRIDFRIIETQQDGSQIFRRRQFDGALALASLAAGDLAPTWQKLDQTIGAFVGESDNMRVDEFPALLARLGTTDLAAVRALDDAAIAAAIVAGNFGAQRISSHIMINGMGKGTLPLSRTFLLMGQRYVVDSHVFSNVVYDRAGKGAVTRMMPNPLDVGFAALANNQAATLLANELTKYPYAPDLASMRVLVDDHGEGYWSANLYNGWLAALRALSRAGAGQSAPLEIAGTEAWGRRILNAQLASWAELRHDTILYVKQSYTTGVSCEFPDALVEPSPEFFARIKAFAEKGAQVVAALPVGTANLTKPMADYFTHLSSVADMLGDMAEYQASGTPFTQAHMAFINEAVTIQALCGGASAFGWYPKLFFRTDATEFKPTIADVHTQPTDEAGNPVGRVLHVGTGNARLMVLTANTCNGPRAYAGLVSSYFEETTENYQRLDDPTWSKRFNSAATFPTDVPWLQDLIAR